ncbi:MAG: class I SAM-dependent methyltransferase [Bacteroidetes bacterium]|nr:class I SAM-dependent methyltransferase [Bacteroidota bacterium]
MEDNNYFAKAKEYHDWIAYRENKSSKYWQQIFPVIEKMVGNIGGEKILDYGCGDGIVANYFAQKGAYVFGVDINKDLIEYAQAHFNLANFEIIEDSDDNLKNINNHFDKILSSVVFQYIENIDSPLGQMHKLLKNNGQLIVAMPHPLKSTENNLVYVNGKWLLQISDYYMNGARERKFGSDHGDKIYHRNFSEIVNMFQRNMFHINEIVETKPSEEDLLIRPERIIDLHRPYAIVIKAEKYCKIY